MLIPKRWYCRGPPGTIFSLWQLALSHDVARDNVRLVRGNLISERSRTALFDSFDSIKTEGLRDSKFGMAGASRTGHCEYSSLSHYDLKGWVTGFNVRRFGYETPRSACRLKV